jgi:peptidylprolyl isomerase
VANEKRARQDANRHQKLAKVATEQKKVQTVEQRNKFLKIGGGLVALVVLILLLNKCSSNGSGSSSDTTVASSSTISSATTAPKYASPKLNTKPVVTIPSTPAPTKLDSKDLVVGTGATVEAGDTVFVQYVGNSWSTKKEFDSSWSRGAEPFEVVSVGNAPVIKGWNQGLIGMKVGGRRQLVIPPDLAYGSAAQGADIKANETLVFVIDAVRVIKAADVAKTTIPSAPTIAQ